MGRWKVLEMEGWGGHKTVRVCFMPLSCGLRDGDSDSDDS